MPSPDATTAQLAFSALLVLISGGFVWHHLAAWEAARCHPENLKAIEFARRQFRRRMQASLMVGFVGLAIAGALLIHDTLLIAMYWVGILLVVIWILLLAIMDALSSFTFLKQQRKRHLVEQAELQAELLREIKRRRDTGTSDN